VVVGVVVGMAAAAVVGVVQGSSGSSGSSGGSGSGVVVVVVSSSSRYSACRSRGWGTVQGEGMFKWISKKRRSVSS